MQRISGRIVRQMLSVCLRVLAVFLAAGLCSFLTLYRPVLRVTYEGLSGYLAFVTQLHTAWQLAAPLVLPDYANSLLALSAAMVVALAVGVPAGLLAGTRPSSPVGTLVRFGSYLGSMTPAFLLALGVMVFFVLYALPATGIRFILLSSQSSTFDPRRLLPVALTLAARPLAHITLVTAAAAREAAAADYMRTARAKGLSGVALLVRHLVPNVGSSVAAALPAVVLFSISSLSIVEFVFNWPGAGQELLYRIVVPSESNATSSALVGFLLTGLGLTYVAALLLSGMLCRLFDPRLREDGV